MLAVGKLTIKAGTYLSNLAGGCFFLLPVVASHARRPILVTPAAAKPGERRTVEPRPLVFRWCHDRKTLDEEFHRLQKEVGISLPYMENHQHTATYAFYGFHDLRRAFATTNAPRLKPETSQKLMRHKSYQATLRYVAMVDQVREAVDAMPIPAVLRPALVAE